MTLPIIPVASVPTRRRKTQPSAIRGLLCCLLGGAPRKVDYRPRNRADHGPQPRSSSTRDGRNNQSKFIEEVSSKEGPPEGPPRGSMTLDPALLDYTNQVITRGPPDTSHKLLNSYTGEVKGRGEQVTVKVLRVIGDGVSDPNFRNWTTAVAEGLRREISRWKRVQGPFVEYIGFANVDGVPAVLTQFVEGTSAKEAFGMTDDEGRRRLILEFANALKILHQMKLLHGNIEPRHFIIDKQGKPKFGGFCFNQMVEDEWKKINPSPSDEYRRSARYTPPEVLENNPTNHKSDVYSFACVAAELMTGKIPFSGISHEAAVTKQLAKNGEAHLARDYNELQHNPWWTSFKSCWSKEVEARPSMESLCAKLRGSSSIMMPEPSRYTGWSAPPAPPRQGPM